ncbi:MAG: acyltransferase family protein [Deltaproteobacteria bacterium]|nr:acyltransferase family protein [Deltaproteobacteria bacterium]
MNSTAKPPNVAVAMTQPAAAKATSDRVRHRTTTIRRKPTLRRAPAEATSETPRADPVLRDAASTARNDAVGSGIAVDPFGFDRAYAERLAPFLGFLFDHYFRCTVTGESNIPLQGGALLVGNHAGTLPYDGAMVMTAVRRATSGARFARPLGDDFAFRRPPVATWLSRIGVVRATPDNAHRLLSAGEIALVFPEGTRGLGKFFAERYRLTRFGRGGFVKVALRAGVPIIPVAVVGSEEAHPLLAQIPWLARLFGLPYFPVTPTFPWLGPLGLVPLPTKFFIRFGEPLALTDSAASIERSSDRLAELTEIVRTRVQAMIDELLAVRRSVFLG